MNTKNLQAYLALHQTAKHEGVSYESVVQNIEEVIQEAYTTALKENNQAALDAWHRIPCKGKLPTPIELVTYISELCMLEADG